MPSGQAAWRRPLKFNSLKAYKARQSMSKYNLYNISRLTREFNRLSTFFQQKWKAKSKTRAYHGEHIKEKKWTRMFSRRIYAVVPQSVRFLAKSDGSEFAAGRGSGRHAAPGDKKKAKTVDPTPYMQMIYHPMERRLDTAIFRALFASSARQGRQFCLHGHVKVNGRKMVHPSYMLNPGDIFQVEPETVMWAMGMPKSKAGLKKAFSDAGLSPRLKGELKTKEEARLLGAQKRGLVTATDTLSQDTASKVIEEEAEEDEELDEEFDEDEEAEGQSEDDIVKDRRKTLMKLRDRVDEFLEKPPHPLKNKQKQQLRALKKSLKSSISKARKITPTDIDELETELHMLETAITPATQTTKTNTTIEPEETAVKLDDTEEARRRATADAENPIDPSKPYLTPWKPREFLSAFAFIPRYLEVNQRICAAIYLRHPRCAPGLSEVPTPFEEETSQLAFNWYLRRR